MTFRELAEFIGCGVDLLFHAFITGHRTGQLRSAGRVTSICCKDCGRYFWSRKK